MRFRPCIDIHNGAVKQIVGGSLKEESGGSRAEENFVSEQDGAFYGALYRDKGLKGGHIILLNQAGTAEYEADRRQAKLALGEFPGGLQIGGGVTGGNAEEFLQMGASHVIITSWVFQKGVIRYDRLEELKKRLGRERIVLDVSCRKRNGMYYVVTDRWQTFTEVAVEEPLLDRLAGYCDEFLVHGVDTEGTGTGMERELVEILSGYAARTGLPITYAGGIGSVSHLEEFAGLSRGKLDVTIGSALELFGGTIPLQTVLDLCARWPDSGRNPE